MWRACSMRRLPERGASSPVMTVDNRQTRAAFFVVPGVPPAGGDQLDPTGLRRPPCRAGPSTRGFLTREAGEGDRRRRWRGQERAQWRGKGRRPSDQPRGAPTTVRVAPPPPCFAWSPSPASRWRIAESTAFEPATKVDDRQASAAAPHPRSGGRGTAEGAGAGKNAHSGGARGGGRAISPAALPPRCAWRPLHHASHAPPPPLRG